MRIGFDAKRFFLNNTGLGNYSRDLVRGILEENSTHEYFLFTTKVVENSRTEFLQNYSNVEVVSPESFYKRFKSYWRSVRLEKVLKKYNIDVFYSGDGYMSLRTKIPTTLVIHDLAFLH